MRKQEKEKWKTLFWHVSAVKDCIKDAADDRDEERVKELEDEMWAHISKHYKLCRKRPKPIIFNQRLLNP